MANGKSNVNVRIDTAVKELAAQAFGMYGVRPNNGDRYVLQADYSGTPSALPACRLASFIGGAFA